MTAVPRRRALLHGAALGLMSYIAPRVMAQSPAKLRLSVAVAQSLPLGRMAATWSERLGASSIPVEIHPGAMLAQRDPSREFLALRDGAADLAVGSALLWSTQLSPLAIYALPWIADEPRALRAMVAHPNVQRAIVLGADEHGVIVLALAPLGYRDVATRTGPPTTPEGLRGLRLRIASHPLIVDLYAALGAHGSSLDFAQAQAALAAGRLDGEEGNPPNLASARLGALGLRSLLRWGGVADVAVYAVRRPVWDRWTQPQRDQALAAARQTALEIDALADEEEALVELRKQGMTVQRLAPLQREAFRAATRSVFDKWRGIVGADLVDQAVVIAGAAREAPR